MFSYLKRPPFVGVIAFMSVLAVQPLGHIVMILMEKLIATGEAWYSPVFDSQPQIPAGFENFALIENNLYISAFFLGLLGLCIVYWGIRRNTEIAGTWAGFVGATLLWTGWVEFSLHYFSRFYGIKALCAPGDWAYACVHNPSTKPEYFLMQASVGFLIVVMMFFLFNKESRCNAFRWLHRNLKLNVGRPTPGLARNFANTVAIETLTILWFFYVFLMFIYDENVFGERHWFTYLSFASFAVWALYLVQRLLRYKRVTSALRYAIPTAIIFWNSIEIMGRWDWFTEFWIHPLEYKLSSTILLLAVISFLYVSIKTARDRNRQIE